MKRRGLQRRPENADLPPEPDWDSFDPADQPFYEPEEDWGYEADDDPAGADDPAEDAATEDAATPLPARPRAEPVEVGPDDAGLRLDRWFRRHYPHVGHGTLERWLRTGQVRLDGRRARAADRVEAGQQVRVPPAAHVPTAGKPSRPPAPPPTPEEAAELARRVLYRDEQVLVIDKPAGLAVQGGTRTTHHLDGLLDALAFDGERPRLVHRLDRDTSGVLVLARTAAAASKLAAAFASRAVHKLYWAVVVGVPRIAAGKISQPLSKRFGAAGERVGADDEGDAAVTFYRVIEHAGSSAAWLALLPRTGRTHQLRAHCTLLGTPILGDGKYGGASAFLAEVGDATRLHLHARAIQFPHPERGTVTVEAPLPAHMGETFDFFGFDASTADGMPAEWDEPHRPAAKRTSRTDGADTRRSSARTGTRPPKPPQRGGHHSGHRSGPRSGQGGGRGDAPQTPRKPRG